MGSNPAKGPKKGVCLQLLKLQLLLRRQHHQQQQQHKIYAHYLHLQLAKAIRDSAYVN